MDDNNDGWEVEFGESENRGNNGSLSILNFLFILVLAGVFTYLLLVPSTPDPNPRVNLSTLTQEERDILYPQYRDELFGIVKQNRSDYRLIDKLLQSGVSIDTQDDKGKTVLFYAAINKNERMLRHLIFKKANVTIKDFDGKYAIDYLDKLKDRQLYISLYDAQIRHEALARGAMQVNIVHSMDAQGNILSTTLNGEVYKGH